MRNAKKVVLFGAGDCALALAQLYIEAGDRPFIYATTRGAAFGEKAAMLENLGITCFSEQDDDFFEKVRKAVDGACVLVSYPPSSADCASSAVDSGAAKLVCEAEKIVYVSSTSVYRNQTGIIDEQTPVIEDSHNAARLNAEKFWRDRGACVLRAPSLYSRKKGLHERLLAGTYKIPGDGSNYVSRIHLDDLASIIDAAFRLSGVGTSYIVGDLKPATHLEVVTWLCRQLSLPRPPFAPLAELHETLRANRQVDAGRVLSDFQIKLKYPTYVEGFGDAIRQQ